MNQKIRIALLALSLASAVGCAKKETPTPDPAPTSGVGSYQLDTRQNSNGQTSSRTINAQVKSLTSRDSGYDYLELQFVTTPQPASGAEKLTLYFSKPSGQPNSTYILDDIVKYDNVWPRGYPFDNDAATIVSTSNGGFSGTFSGTMGSLTGGFITSTYVELKGGIFTNARP